MDFEFSEHDVDCIRNVIGFLKDNEQYGDDWSAEIETLDKLMDFLS